MEPLVLTVDMAGLPQAWVALEEAITYHAKQMVAWSLGSEVREFRGGWQRNGERSRIATKSILAIKGTGAGAHLHAPGSPTRCCSRVTGSCVPTAASGT